MVISLSSDPAVRNAALSNARVQELRHYIPPGSIYYSSFFLTDHIYLVIYATESLHFLNVTNFNADCNTNITGPEMDAEGSEAAKIKHL